VLSAFTGAHEDYHRPTDTPDKINYPGTRQVARLVGLVARGLATADSVPEYRAMEKPENLGRRAALRAYLGTIPDYAQGDEPGVKLSGVAKGGPADTAGVRGGDVIIGLAGKDVKNIYDYTYVIEALKIGEAVTVKVLRDGDELELTVTPGSRD
jgi:S1-C subfamily serine protease